MAKTYQALLSEARARVAQISLERLRERLAGGEPLALIDVRERDEAREGVIPGARVIPRGLLELQAERALPDREATVVVYCASGARSALAAATLLDLGYRSVLAAEAGFLRWRELGYPVEVPPSLTEAQRLRYGRHLRLPEVGELGQARLLGARVLLLGAGGLGSPAALYLAAAGVGTLGLVDDDVVDLSNLQRQVLHGTSRVGRPKVESAAQAIAELNPDVRVVPLRERLGPGNVDRIFGDFDLIVDGCDNFATRYLVNDASLAHQKPVVHGSVFRFEGQVTTFYPGRGPCYRCLFPQPPPPHLSPACAEAGVLGVLPGVVGVLQATEAIKLLLGKGDALIGRLLTYDSLSMRFREIGYRRSPRCPGCGERPAQRADGEQGAGCASR